MGVSRVLADGQEVAGGDNAARADDATGLGQGT
jgi:hypothetical protein